MLDVREPNRDRWELRAISSSSTAALPPWNSLREQLEEYSHDLARFLVMEPLEVINVTHCWYCGGRVISYSVECSHCAAPDWDRTR
jgi:hypothetical protein